MSFWSHNPELLDELTIKFLPDPWKSQIENDEINLNDVPDDVIGKAMTAGEEDFWADQIEAAKMRMENRQKQEKQFNE